MKRAIVPDVVSGEQDLFFIAPSLTVAEVAIQMAERHVAAALVIDDETLVGIVTERDLVFRVMAKSLDPKAVSVGEVMTRDPIIVSPNEDALAALEKMRRGHFRHLPVTHGGAVIGIVSIRDLYEAMAKNLQEELQNAETLIFGDQYGMSA